MVDAIVILGGGERSLDPPRVLPEVNEAGDRLIYGAWLYRRGRAPNVLVTGGRIDFLRSTTPGAVSMAALLEFFGVPQQAIWLESEARNTYENATYSRQLLTEHQAHRILLVTSALHMPRAVRLFERQGLDVIPAPTDFLISDAEWADITRADVRTQLIYLLPDSESLFRTTQALKEYIGIAVYGLRGWL